MREFIAIFKIKADIRMNKTTLNSQKEKHSMLSLRRAAVPVLLSFSYSIISIHALLAESDFVYAGSVRQDCHFYPRSPCGERQNLTRGRVQLQRISIHALLAESDDIIPPQQRAAAYFYPRSPCGERLPATRSEGCTSLFLSTLSLRRATEKSLVVSRPLRISIHALLAESDGQGTRHSGTLRHFYPRSPCGERRMCPWSAWRLVRFLSTLSLRRATPPGSTPGRTAKISIHALLAESDVYLAGIPAKANHFYPRSPCGERRFLRWMTTRQPPFLSTLSLRRATNTSPGPNSRTPISIHALLAESDQHTGTSWAAWFPFLSTLSLRRATCAACRPCQCCRISIHALLAESDAW